MKNENIVKSYAENSNTPLFFQIYISLNRSDNRTNLAMALYRFDLLFHYIKKAAKLTLSGFVAFGVNRDL